MKKFISQKVSLFLIGLGVLSFLVFWGIGSKVDANGFLRESFGLIPLGWLLIAIGTFVGVASCVTTRTQ